MSDVKAAVLGTNDYHGVMRQVVKNSLQRQAGYVPSRGVFVDEPDANFILYEYTGYSAEVFHALSKFVKGYGWIAGGSAFHFVHAEKIGYGDVDVFCVSQAAYETLHECFQSYITTSNERSCVAESAMFGLSKGERYAMSVNINLLCPLPDEDWSHPANVLLDFDGITTPAVAIIEPGLAYTPFRDDVLNRHINYIGKCRNPVRLWRRVMKYYRRGCLFGEMFWKDLLADSRTRQLVYMAQDMYEMAGTPGTAQHMNGDFLHACWAIADYEGYEVEEEDSLELDREYDGWY